MTVTVLTHAVIYTGYECINEGYIRFDDKILAVGPMAEYRPQAGEEIKNLRGMTVIPGFIDVHAHGGYGFDAMDGDADQIDKMATNMLEHEGVTTLFATTMTQSVANIDQAMRGVGEAADRNPVIQGVHLEGPFINVNFKGAQPEEYIHVPDADLVKKWKELSGGRVKLITYAPEKPGAREFEDALISMDIVPSVGHSNATRADMLNSKASHVTHLYNAQREFKHREPGVTGHAMLEPQIYAELIADGSHIVPDMLKLAFRVKGADRIELVTDSMRSKGMPEGESELGGQKVYVKDKQARLADGTLAGSVLMYKDAFKNAINFMGASVADAVKMSSVNQATEFHLEHKGSLEVGKDADINVLTPELDLTASYSFGQYHETIND